MSELTIKDRARVALTRARAKRWKLREISEKTGLTMGHLLTIYNGGSFSDDAALAIISGCKLLGKAQ